MGSKPSLSDLASMNSLSKSPKTNSMGSKPSLSDLASMNSLSKSPKTNMMGSKPSLSDLASMNSLSKSPKTNMMGSKPSLSDLASMNSLSKSPKTRTIGFKPNLNELASTSHVVKKVPSAGHPKINLADLAKLNLNQSNVDQSRSRTQSETAMGDGQPQAGHLNLASALRSKCTIADKRAIPTLKGRRQDAESVLFTPISAKSETVDPAFVLRQASRLGRVMTKAAKRSPSVFLKFDLQSRLKLQTAGIEPFIFDTPSPDDVIQRRLRTVKKE